jgi:hypothetical protein
LERRPVWKAAIQGGNADTRPTRNLVEGRVRSELDKNVARGGQDVLAIALSVGAQPAPARCG